MDEFDELEAAYQRSLNPTAPEESTPASEVALPFDPEPDAVERSLDYTVRTVNDGAAVTANVDVTPSDGIVTSVPRSTDSYTWNLQGVDPVIGLRARITELETELQELTDKQTPSANPFIDTSILQNQQTYDIAATNIVQEFWNKRVFWMPISNFRNFIASSPRASENSLLSEKILWPPPSNLSENESNFIISRNMTPSEDAGVEYVQVKVMSNNGMHIYMEVQPLNSWNVSQALEPVTPFVIKVDYSEVPGLNLRSFNTNCGRYPDDFAVGVGFSHTHSDWAAYENGYVVWKEAQVAASIESIEFKKELTASMDLAYPGDWDFLDIVELDEDLKTSLLPNISSSDRSSLILPTIKFESFDISNRDGRSRAIRDLYVTIPFKKYSDGRFKPVGCLLGTRSKITGNEYNSRYIHSHLPTGVRIFSRFCLGGGTPMANMMADLSMNFDMLKFDFLLSQLHGYVRYESLEGGPHIRMENIDSMSGSSFVNESYLRNYYQDFLRSCETNDSYPDVNFNVEEGNFELDILNSDFQDKVLAVVNEPQHRASLGTDNTFTPLDGGARNHVPNGEEARNFARRMFNFRGENVYGEILPNNTIDENPQRIVPNKGILTYIAESLAINAKEYLLMKTENETN